MSNQMSFLFEPLRATQAAALVVESEGGRMLLEKLLFVMYMANRQSLIQTGSPLFGGEVAHTCLTPIPLTLRDHINKASPQDAWNQTFGSILTPNGPELVLLTRPGDGELSDFDCDLLRHLQEAYRNYEFRSLMQIEAITLPEWVGVSEETPFAYEDILRAEDFSAGDIRAYQERNAAIRVFDSIRIVR